MYRWKKRKYLLSHPLNVEIRELNLGCHRAGQGGGSATQHRHSKTKDETNVPQHPFHTHLHCVCPISTYGKGPMCFTNAKEDKQVVEFEKTFTLYSRDLKSNTKWKVYPATRQGGLSVQVGANLLKQNAWTRTSNSVSVACEVSVACATQTIL